MIHDETLDTSKKQMFGKRIKDPRWSTSSPGKRKQITRYIKKISFVQTLTCFRDETRHSMTVMEAWLTKPTDAMSDRFEML